MRRRIEQTRDLQSVVGTMKALAAVSIQQYEQAARSLDVFNESIDLGLQVVLRDLAVWSRGGRRGARAAIVLGSDQGMCGRFNEDVASRAGNDLGGPGAPDVWTMLAAGERLVPLLEHQGRRVDRRFSMPGSVTGILPLVQDLIIGLGMDTAVVDELVVVYNHYTSGSSYETRSLRLLPLDEAFFHDYRERKWPTRMLPVHTIDTRELFADLIRHHFFVALYRAVAHSLAGENASRLAVMQAAEKNVEERLEELTTLYHQSRQAAITGELLEIVSGFTVLAD